MKEIDYDLSLNMESKLLALGVFGMEYKWIKILLFDFPCWLDLFFLLFLQSDDTTVIIIAISKIFNGKSRQVHLQYVAFWDNYLVGE